MTHSCKFQILIKLACFQYRNPNVSKVLHIHFVTFLTHGTNKKIVPKNIEFHKGNRSQK